MDKVQEPSNSDGKVSFVIRPANVTRFQKPSDSDGKVSFVIRPSNVTKLDRL
jgi:hypothetical protein